MTDKNDGLSLGYSLRLAAARLLLARFIPAPWVMWALDAWPFRPAGQPKVRDHKSWYETGDIAPEDFTREKWGQ